MRVVGRVVLAAGLGSPALRQAEMPAATGKTGLDANIFQPRMDIDEHGSNKATLKTGRDVTRMTLMNAN